MPEPRPIRVSNRYLLRLLSALVRLGSANVSARLLIETWTDAGNVVDEVFSMHYDVLFDYGFVVVAKEPAPGMSMQSILHGAESVDSLICLTHQGREFLERYG